MIPPNVFIVELQRRKFSFFTGVPCSFFKDAINIVSDNSKLQYMIAPNEGSALAAAAGASLAGKRSVVMIQNSGLGNLINPLTSLNMIYRVPCLVFVSGRAYGVKDEPQHEVIGAKMGQLLDSLGIQHQDLPQDGHDLPQALNEAVSTMENEQTPFFFFVRKGSIGGYETKTKTSNSYPLKRIDAIKIISESLTGTEYIIATTGKPSRELFTVSDREHHFYMQGSMGHAASIGLGAALSQPKKKIVILDGDGALIMHMGILSTIGHHKPKNLFHIVLDNESYETTGDQDTTSRTTDFVSVAKASGYLFADETSSSSDLKKKMAHMMKQNGPALLRVKINRLPTPDIPRITTKHTSEQIARTFQQKLSSGS
jgi:phosphonopyruvate decarboxylase